LQSIGEARAGIKYQDGGQGRSCSPGSGTSDRKAYRGPGRGHRARKLTVGEDRSRPTPGSLPGAAPAQTSAARGLQALLARCAGPRVYACRGCPSRALGGKGEGRPRPTRCTLPAPVCGRSRSPRRSQLAVVYEDAHLIVIRQAGQGHAGASRPPATPLARWSNAPSGSLRGQPIGHRRPSKTAGPFVHRLDKDTTRPAGGGQDGRRPPSPCAAVCRHTVPTASSRRGLPGPLGVGCPRAPPAERWTRPSVAAASTAPRWAVVAAQRGPAGRLTH